MAVKAVKRKAEDVKGSKRVKKKKQARATTAGTSNFDFKLFRKELAAGAGNVTALNQFLRVVEGDSENVNAYLSAGGHSGEILRQISEDHKKNPSVAAAVFDVLKAMFEKILADLPEHRREAEETSRYFLNSYMPTIDFMLGDKNTPREWISALGLLASVVGFNSELGFLILNQLNFQPRRISHLVRHKFSKDGENARTSFIFFVLSFLSEGNASLAKSLIEKQGVLSMVIGDLTKDAPEVISRVIDVLKDRVLMNAGISKTAKMKVFNSEVIAQLFDLFDRKGRSRSHDGFVEANIDVTIAELLFELCTSQKLGIHFADPTLGTSEPHANRHLCKAFESLRTPWNRESARGLIVKIVSRRPDLLRPAMNAIDESFVPRNSEGWAKTNDFLKDMLDVSSSKAVIESVVEMNTTNIFTFMKNACLSTNIMTKSTEGLKSSDFAIKNQIVLLLRTILDSIERYFTAFKERNVANARDLLEKTRECVKKHFPSLDYLISLIHMAMDKKKFFVNPMEVDDLSLNMPTDVEFLQNVLDLLLIYEKIIPESLDPVSVTLDSKRMFEKISSMETDDKEKLMLKITMFLLSADKHAFAPGKPLFGDILRAMFVVFFSADSDSSSEAEKVLQNIFTTTGLFERNVEEIDILLKIIHGMDRTEVDIAAVVISLIKNCNENIDRYTAKLESFDSIETNQEEAYEYNFDELFESLGTEENQNKPMIAFEKPLLTEFFIGIMKFVPEPENERAFALLKSKYLINLFHIQENTHNFVSIINAHEIDKHVQKYISKWTECPVNISSKIYDKSTFVYKLSKHLLMDEFDFENDPGDINSSNIVIGFNMTLFYMRSLISLDMLTEEKALKCKTTLMDILEESNVQSKQLCVKLFKKILSNNIVFANFKLLSRKSSKYNEFITELIIYIINSFNDYKISSFNIDHSLVPYKQKVFSALKQCLKKCMKNKHTADFTNLDKILSVIGLRISDIPILIEAIVDIDISCITSTDEEIAFWLKILCFSLNTYTESGNVFSVDQLKNISTFYSKLISLSEISINLTEFEEALHNHLMKNPEFISSVPYAVFESTFDIKHINKSTVKLAKQLLKVNENIVPKLIKIIKKVDVLEKRELIIPLLQTALMHPKFVTEKEVIENIYQKYEPMITKIIEKPHKAAQLYIENYLLFEFLIRTCMSESDCQNFFTKLRKYESAELFHASLLKAVYLKGISNETVPEKIHENYVLSILSLSSIALKKEDVQNVLIENLSECLKDFISYCPFIYKDKDETDKLLKSINGNSIWQNFVKSVLKHSMDIEKESSSCHALMNVLSLLIDFLYCEPHEDVKNIFEMTTSHSEFLNIILSNQHKNLKLCLVKLLLILLQKDVSIAKATHIPIYLSAYHATRSPIDRIILKILNMYESSGISMAEYQPYLWGDTASNHYAVRVKRNRRTLWSNPTPNHVLNLLDREMIFKTVKYFSIQSSLESNTDFVNCSNMVVNNNLIKSVLNGITNKQHNSNVLSHKLSQSIHSNFMGKLKNDENAIFETEEEIESTIYDPSFLLPLLNFIMAPGSLVYTHRVVRGGVLAIPLVSLSSTCPEVRAAAYTVLHRFYTLLESEMYYKKDKLLWTGFFDSLKSSMNTALSDTVEDGNSTPIPRLPGIAAVYLARSVFIMMNPLDPLFKSVNYFIIGKMSVNFSVIPDFLDLLHNSDIVHNERRIWMLKVIRDGIKSFTDVKVLMKSVAFKILLDFYNCSLATDEAKMLILEILNACILIPKAGKILREGYGLFSWISFVCRNANRENKALIFMIVKIISNSWYSFSSHSFAKIDKSKKIETFSCLSDDIQHEFMCVLIYLLPKLSQNELDTTILYMDTFRKLNRNCIKTFNEAQMLSLLSETTKPLTNVKLNALIENVLKDKKKQYLLPYMLLIEQYDKDSKEYILLKHLHDVIRIWIS